MPAYRLIVFDWDGTLMDSIPTIVACTRAALADLGVEAPPEVALRRNIGLGLRECIEAMVPGADDAMHVAVAERYRDHWLATFLHQPRLYPASRGVVETLHAAGHLLAVATSKSRRGLERELDATGLGPLFAATRTVDEAPAKPAPGMLLGLMDELAVAPEATLMIGDTRWDLEMAAAAGVEAVAVAGGAQAAEELATYGALAVLPGVGALPAWLAARSVTPSLDPATTGAK